MLKRILAGLDEQLPIGIGAYNARAGARARARDRASARRPQRLTDATRVVLAVECLLGRYPADGESVRHRKGVRDDNPSGIGVSDALVLAHAIIEHCEGTGAPPTMLTVSAEQSLR